MEAAPVDSDYHETASRQKDTKSVLVIALKASPEIVLHALDCGKLRAVRVVIDTNVLLSACLKPDGLEARVVDMALRREIQACVTGAVLDEYADVLRRDKFRDVRERAETLLAAIESCALQVVTEETISAASDEDDNRFLECAVAAEADYLITGNLRHYPPAWRSVRVVNARGFMERQD